jgi:hypothetical protein
MFYSLKLGGRRQRPEYLPAESDSVVRLRGLDGGLDVISGVEIRGRPIVGDHHFLGKDDHALTDGSSSDDLIFAFVVLLDEEGPLSFGRDYQVYQRW